MASRAPSFSSGSSGAARPSRARGGARSRPAPARGPRQLALALPEPPPRRVRGGARTGAGRKPRPENVRRPLTKHVARPALVSRHPVHVTLRAHRGLPTFRAQALQRVLERNLARVAAADFQVVHYSLQRDHVHLVVEARDREALSRGMRRLVIGLALRLNQAIGRGRRGKVWGDRWHRHDLRTPREVRNALVYLFGNARHHGLAATLSALDRYSSAGRFAGWRATREAPDVGLARAGPSAAGRAEETWSPPGARTWLLRGGYEKAGGPLLVDEVTGR